MQNHPRNHKGKVVSTVVDVEKLIKEAEEVKNSDLKAALAELAEQEKKKNQVKLLAQFQEAKRHRDNALAALKKAREAEAAAKANLVKIQTALNDFTEDGNFLNFLDKAVAAPWDGHRNHPLL